MQAEDPGWPPVSDVLLLFVPGVGLRRVHRRDDVLLATRAVVVNFSLSLVLFGCVIASLAMPHGSAGWLGAVGAAALMSVVADHFTERPLDCSSDASLAASFRARFFLRVAFAESVTLIGFMLAFTVGPKWVFYPAAAFSLWRLWTHAAPTKQALERDQAKLRDAGCRRLLVAALRSSGREGRAELA
jgi:hypothetical protein